VKECRHQHDHRPPLRASPRPPTEVNKASHPRHEKSTYSVTSHYRKMRRNFNAYLMCMLQRLSNGPDNGMLP